MPLPLDVALLRECIDYDPATGALTWRRRPLEHFRDGISHSASRICAIWNARYAGKPALNHCEGLYRYGTLNGQVLRAHRVAHALATGCDTPDEIDHINGVKHDNRAVNLRPVKRMENMRNRRRQKNNTSGHTGVTWNRLRGRWRVTIGVGDFEDLSDAAAAYERAKCALAFHPNHGKPALPPVGGASDPAPTPPFTPSTGASSS